MLDAFIIERIQQQQRRQESARDPLRVEIPLRQDPEEPPSPDRDEPGEPHRGVVIIDDVV